MQLDPRGSGKMNILIVSNGYPPLEVGGVETYSAELSYSLTRHGHKVTIFCRHSDLTKPDYEISTEHLDGVKILRVINDHKQAKSFRQTFTDPKLEQIFRDHIAAERPDLIHFNHLIGLSARLPLIASEQNIPSTITLHDFWPICQRVKLMNWQGQICPGPRHGVDCAVCVAGGSVPQNVSSILANFTQIIKRILPVRWRRFIRATLPAGESQPPALTSTPQIFIDRLALFTDALLACQRVLVPSEYVSTQYCNNGFPRHLFTVVPLGVPLQPKRQSYKQHSNQLNFAAIGPLQPIKGMDTAIKAFSKVPGDRLSLKIYGRDDLFPRDYVQKVFELAQADPRVSLMGPFDPSERGAIFDTIDILIVPSPAPETFSLVAHEALALGKPVLATRIGALANVIRDGINGYLFEPGNAHQLAEYIGALAAETELIGKFSFPGTESVLTTEEHAIEIETIFRQVLGKYGQTASGSLLTGPS